ncbi:protein SHQ1 homolog [Euwallacea fornicatus]|uniref:protein SHQ1 homolog n=1 Tax=Euwallacea fornicatus TaxID=995702 RepID=UPI00338F783A
MITPRFKLSQEENCITINVRAPYCNLSELEIYVEDNVFLFVCKPYYLRLTLPGEILEDENSKSSFDTDSGEFSFTFTKVISGENFKDLDLITTFLTTKVEANCPEGIIPIEVLTETQIDGGAVDSVEKSLEYAYGFAMRGNKNFGQVCSEFDEVFEINPCEVPMKERRKLRIQYEQGKFNMDHYLADFVDNEAVCEIIAQKCPYKESHSISNFSFSDKELDFLKDLPNVQYKLDQKQILYCYNGLVDILFAYCYDQRITQFEANIESSWTISKIAATLCWFEGFDNPRDTVISAYRRSLIYPLYRHFDLTQVVFDDVKALLSLEEKHIVRILIEIYNIFLHSDKYVLNNLFIKDYIVYAMKWNRVTWRDMVQQYTDLKITKQDVGLNLNQIEEAFIPEARFAAMKITDNESDSDDHESSSSECSSDDSSSSEYSSDSESDAEEGVKGRTVTVVRSEGLNKVLTQ